MIAIRSSRRRLRTKAITIDIASGAADEFGKSERSRDIRDTKEKPALYDALAILSKRETAAIYVPLDR